MVHGTLHKHLQISTPLTIANVPVVSSGTSELATIASHRRAYGLIRGVEQSISHKYALTP